MLGQRLAGRRWRPLSRRLRSNDRVAGVQWTPREAKQRPRREPRTEAEKAAQRADGRGRSTGRGRCGVIADRRSALQCGRRRKKPITDRRYNADGKEKSRSLFRKYLCKKIGKACQPYQFFMSSKTDASLRRTPQGRFFYFPIDRNSRMTALNAAITLSTRAL